MPHPFKTLAEANDAFASLAGEHETAKTALAAAEGEALKSLGDIQTITAERDTATAKVADIESEKAILAGGLNEANAKISAHAAALTEAKTVTNAKIREVMQAAGHPSPLRIAGSTDDPETPAKPDVSKLTGLAKAIAAHTAASTK